MLGLLVRFDLVPATLENMGLASVAENLNLGVGLNYLDYVEAHFIRLAYAEGLMTVIGAGWVTRADLSEAPGAMLGRPDYFHGASKERVVRLDRAVCHLILNERSLVARIAAREVAHAEAALRTIAHALPEVDSADREVPARFWWWAPNVPRDLARMLPSPPWAEIESGGRLLLWHGEPGTGKTSAIRSLTGEWRSWAEFQFITDPEEFLSNPGYLLAAIAESRGSQPTGPINRWKIIVLEDAGEFLAPDAKHLKGQALSRLLNVCDAVLGQAMRALVLVTTNEPLRHLHPALARPGRCLAEIAFKRFDREEMAAWCTRHDVDPLDLRAASLADLYAQLDGRPPAPRKLAIGFAPAAA